MLCHAVFTPDKQAALSTFFFSSLSVPPGQFVLEKRQTSDEVDRRGRATSKGRQTEPPSDPVQANALLTLLPSVNVAAAATATQVAATAATSAATETSDSWRGGAVAAQPKAVVVQSHNNSDSQLGQSFNGFSYFFFCCCHTALDTGRNFGWSSSAFIRPVVLPFPFGGQKSATSQPMLPPPHSLCLFLPQSHQVAAIYCPPAINEWENWMNLAPPPWVARISGRRFV